MSQMDENQLANDAAFMDKYSRQIGAFGMETMAKLITLRVLIVGLKGVGVEIAKNLILAGPGRVSLHDNTPTSIEDLGSNFFLTEEDLGVARATVCAPKLQELNSMVSVRSVEGELTEELVADHDAVVMTLSSLDELKRWSTFCHEQNIAFIATEVKGVAGFVFSDFGSHVVKDKNGEAPITRIITGIENGPEPAITLLGAWGEDEGRHHNIDDDEHYGWIELSDVEGMVGPDGQSINEMGPFRVKPYYHKVKEIKKTSDGEEKEVERQIFDPFRLVLSSIPPSGEGSSMVEEDKTAEESASVDTTDFSAYVNGGIMTQIKRPVPLHHRSFEENLKNPIAPEEFMMLFTDGTKFGRGEQLFMAFLALWEFEASQGRAPNAWDEADAATLVEIANRINEERSQDEDTFNVEEVDADLIKSLSYVASVDFQPYCAFFGGVVAQEIVKLTGKFSPLNQWLHLDCVEMLPEEKPTDATPQGSRYDAMYKVFGQNFVEETVRNVRTFMIGCGALGCEFLKNFALIGVATGDNGQIITTDNDRIEVSNLNRQFLFRSHNVGQPKSLAAANAVRDMNPAINIISHENLVSPNSEDIYDDQFWEGQTFITNALDNVKAREYVDGRCVFYEKPLLESGTLGTKCNVQVIVPHITASYTDIKDPENEDHIPMCTLRNFPSLIEHCIEWSRAQFEDEFVQPFAEVAKFLDDREGYLKQQRAAGATVTGKEKAVSDMQKLVQVINDAKTITFDACVQKAVDYFCSCFRDRILQLIFNLPEDYVNPKTGELFWTGAKRFPSALEYDPANELAVEFVKSVANIFACCYGLHAPPDQDLLPEDHEWRSNDFINGSVGSYDIPAFVPTAEAIDLGDSKDEDNNSSSSSDESKDRDGTFEDLLTQIGGLDTEGVRVNPADFEKDEDRNFHIDFISAASNLRAANYRIKQASRHKCKMIAGKIIPAIATTTASVCGLVMVEMLKVLQGKGLEAFRDSSNSLGLNMYMLQEPAPAIKAEPGYDHVEMCEVLTYPEDFTKWDKIKIGGGNQLTLGEFMEAFKAETGLNVTFMSHSVSDMEGPQKGKLLYEAYAWSPELKELYASKMNSNLLEYVQERYEGAPIDIAPASRTYIELSIGCANDDEVPHKVPTVIYQYA